MMAANTSKRADPTLICLHFLGGSMATWSAVIDRLAGRLRCLPFDLPGFGDAAGLPGYSVADMADSIAARVKSSEVDRWVIAGHSMGAKIAAILARRAEDGEAGLAGLRGMVLLGGSPPGPEPMQEEQRNAMLGWFTGDRATWPEQARGYIDNNVASPLPPAVMECAMADLMRMRQAAWAAWLQSGSREDWAGRVDVLHTPTLILSGAEDADLGEDAQRRLAAPHYASHRLVTLQDTGHLLPLERPDDVAGLIAAHVDHVCAAA
jgi:pimeloyl-ACP methyl ester carboxylesterase